MRGEVYAHELFTVPPGRAGALLEALRTEGVPIVESLGLELVGAYEVAMGAGTEAIALWAIPDWSTWVDYERGWEPDGAISPWRKTLVELGASWHRQLLVDSPLSPLRIGRQPEESDRLPLEQIR